MENMVDLKEVEHRMEGAVSSFERELSGLRAGRARPALIENLPVEAYDSSLPLCQVAGVTASERQDLTVSVWDASLVKAVEKAIRVSELGLNPSLEGNVLRVHIPPLTEERRGELMKVARQYAEQARVSLRHIRRASMDLAKKREKEEGAGQDDLRKVNGRIQALTDAAMKKIEEILSKKVHDIGHV